MIQNVMDKTLAFLLYFEPLKATENHAWLTVTSKILFDMSLGHYI